MIGGGLEKSMLILESEKLMDEPIDMTLFRREVNDGLDKIDVASSLMAVSYCPLWTSRS